jgi:hypothetical protein
MTLAHRALEAAWPPIYVLQEVGLAYAALQGLYLSVIAPVSMKVNNVRLGS